MCLTFYCLGTLISLLLKGKIERWGYCSETCKDENDGFMYANLNVLEDNECEVLFQPKGGSKVAVGYNKDYEICVGKKHPFPKSVISFTRKTKRKSMIKKQKAEAKKLKLEQGTKPSKYIYIMNKQHTRVSLGTPGNYPYDWFLGGVDSCQGDSGGPLWRNIKVVKLIITIGPRNCRHCISFAITSNHCSCCLVCIPHMLLCIGNLKIIIQFSPF